MIREHGVSRYRQITTAERRSISVALREIQASNPSLHLTGNPGHRLDQRGEVGNRIKELLDGMQIGRTSCSRFWANQSRVLLTVAAYALMQEMRLCAERTRSARAQIETLRMCRTKIGAHVVVSVRRIVLHLPRSIVFLDLWKKIATAAAAAG
jgi:hypothetical protein